MRTTSTTFSALAAISGLGLVLAGCATGAGGEAAPATTSPSPSETHAAAHWTYDGEDGPLNWGALEADYELCGLGTEQSPIDLSTAIAESEDVVELEYGQIEDHIIDTGHTFQLVADGAASVEYDDDTYDLVQMHFHDPSEHTIDGEAAPVEFHFVHENSEGDLLVVGVLGVEGAENAAYAAFIDAATTGAAAGTTGSADLAAMIPADRTHFTYDGSLTTPPCSENVQWIVMETPVELSAAQISALEAAYGRNSRPVQAANGREIGHSTAELDE